MKKTLSALLIIPTLSFAGSALKTEKQKLSYTLGSQVGQLLKQQNVALDTKVLFEGIEDSLNGKKLKLSQVQMQQVLASLRQQQMNHQKNAAKANLKAGKMFLAKNAKRKGIITLANGIQYEVLTKGNGKKHPKKTDKVTVHYEGKLINGTVFDSSYKRGKTVSFPLTGVIKGWTETIPLMSVGSKWNIYIPSELAYAENGAGGSIGPNETLIFKVELVGIN